MDYIVLILNSAIFFAVAFFYKRRYGFGNIGVLYVMFYAILSLIACHLYATKTPSLYSWNNQNILCLIYMMFFVVLFSKILMKAFSRNMMIIHPSFRVMLPVYLVIMIFSLLGIIEIVQDFSYGMIMLMTDDGYGQELYHELNTSVHAGKSSGSVNIISVFSNITKGLAPIMFIYYLTVPKKKIVIVLGLGFSTLITFMLAISSGSRHAIVQNLLSISASMWAFWPYFNHTVKKKITPILLSIAIIIVSGFMFITISRSNATRDGDTVGFIESYTSQSFLFFGSNGFDNGQIRNGERTIPLIKSIFFDDVARSYAEREVKFTRMKINESVFVSFIGDCVFDFGLIGGTFFLFLLYMFLNSFFKRGINSIHVDQVIIIYLIIYLLNGFYSWPFSDFGGNLFFVASVLLCIYIKLFSHETYLYK